MLYASDYPYGQQPASLLIATKTARLSGYGDDDLRAVLAGNARRIVNGEPPLEPTAPIGSSTFSQTMQLARVHQYLSMATPLLWTRQRDTIGILGLALGACDERNGHVEQLNRIRELITTARDLWTELPDEDPDRMNTARATFRLLHLADIEAVTADA